MAVGFLTTKSLQRIELLGHWVLKTPVFFEVVTHLDMQS
jgi:hypothetical protein